MPPNNQTSAQ